MKNGVPSKQGLSRPQILTASFVKRLSTPGRYGDGRGSYGLYLRVWVTANGRIRKLWGQRLRIGYQVTNLGLGSYPAVTLANARKRAIENAQAVVEGRDPRKAVITIPTFSQAVDAVITARSAGWKHEKTAKRWRSTMDRYAMPALSSKTVSAVTAADVMNVLLPIWITKPETGRQVREHLSVVLEWAVGQGYRSDNPAGKAVIKALPKQNQRVQHFKALPFCEVVAAIRRVQETDAWLGTKLCFEFMALTACRSGEGRGATWTELDVEAGLWTIPARRMKNGLEHRVPLSCAALDVLERARVIEDGSGLVFPSQRGKEMTDSTVSKLLRQNGIDTTPHGLRSSFRGLGCGALRCPQGDSGVRIGARRRVGG